ncbi:cytochrome c3 family protein [Gemmatimonadota bacterium]
MELLRHRTITPLLLILLGLLAAQPVQAQENELCMMCHGDISVFQGMERAEDLAVSLEQHSESVHGLAGLNCVDCHMDLAGSEDFPHVEDLMQVECAMCHGDVAAQQAESLHALAAARGDELAPGCIDCHGKHDIRSHTDPLSRTAVMNIPMLCGECHHEGTPVSRNHDIPQDKILENYSLSIHGEGLFRQGLTVTAVCTSCHNSHLILPHTDPRSSIHQNNVAATCTQCHGQIELVHRKVIEGRLWEEEPHMIPACVECHSPHKIRNVFYATGAANRDCLSCHDDPDLTMVVEGETVSLFMDEQAYNASSHSGTACAQCHTGVTSSLNRPCETITAPVDCSICHVEEAGLHANSVHGKMLAEGNTEAPGCLDCHDNHATMSKLLPTSPTFSRNIPDLCAECHRDGEPGAKRSQVELGDVVSSYRMSIHGKGMLESGLTVTATCSSCHSAHGPLPPEDPASTVHPDNIAGTCGTCHNGIEETFMGSVHWPGNSTAAPEDLPTCEDCHTSHNISRVDRSDFRLMMMEQCGTCHEEEAETFFDTYHGKVSRLGEAGAAKCYDCHGTHNILPPALATSTLSRQNIVETCAQCHPGANRRFAGYLTHATHHDPDKYPYLFWAFWAMTALLVGTLTFAMFHTVAWLWRLWRSPEHRIKHRAQPGEKLYRRFTTFQRSLHVGMMISFILLAGTGMALKFSYMLWAQLLARLMGGFGSMGLIHRTAAVALITIFAIHLWDVVRQKRESGMTWKHFILKAPNSMMFSLTDLKDLIGSVKWFLGRGPRPHYGRFTYWEKFDYFAVFWGMFIIGSTGLILWFPEFFTLILPGQTVNVATIIHSDEALLAVAFIFTVHFFNTHFRLDKFPMDPVMFTGRVPIEEFKHDKPREYAELVSKGKLADHLVDPYPPKVERAMKAFGFVALSLGLTLIFLILYTMLFGYR